MSANIRLKDLFVDPDLSWPRMKKGFDAIDAKLGTTLFQLNSHGKMAAFACDKPETHRMLLRIKDGWDPEVWHPGTDRKTMERWAAGS